MGGMSELALKEGPAASGVVMERAALPATTGDAASLMAVISRIAENPDIDLARIEKMLDMYERIQARQAESAYTAALAEMQEELPVIAERGEIRTDRDKSKPPQSTYARWEDINEAIKPVLAKHGFALSFRTGQEEGKIVVTGVLSHREGHKEATTMHLPIDTSGSKNAVQAVGSSTSYGKRYTASALLNLTSRGEDDDGQMSGSMSITKAQLDALNILADQAHADKRGFCEFMGVQSMAEIPAAHYRKAEDALKAKMRKVAQHA